ncbi:MAG TPA: glycosyltransferase family 2 protein, partial [Arachidicoccus soli]|nr:glycosyltransferase family 2 protein [Arachidicoccus soli]
MNNSVSVVMITYGHEKYIAQAISGVIIQQCNFPVEFIIADDHSPDNTEQVVSDFIKNKTIPENIQIKYTRHAANKGMIENFKWALEQAQGKYIAICEGDDYWTDPLKLQKQVDFMEENEDCGVCGTFVDIMRGEIIEKRIPPFTQEVFYLNDLISNNRLPTLTIVFRNKL